MEYEYILDACTPTYIQVLVIVGPPKSRTMQNGIGSSVEAVKIYQVEIGEIFRDGSNAVPRLLWARRSA